MCVCVCLCVLYVMYAGIVMIIIDVTDVILMCKLTNSKHCNAHPYFQNVTVSDTKTVYFAYAGMKGCMGAVRAV